jgi:hypothetical protein
MEPQKREEKKNTHSTGREIRRKNVDSFKVPKEKFLLGGQASQQREQIAHKETNNPGIEVCLPSIKRRITTRTKWEK